MTGRATALLAIVVVAVAGRRSSKPFRDCGFHDHLDPEGVTGRIEVRIE